MARESCFLSPSMLLRFAVVFLVLSPMVSNCGWFFKVTLQPLKAPKISTKDKLAYLHNKICGKSSGFKPTISKEGLKPSPTSMTARQLVNTIYPGLLKSPEQMKNMESQAFPQTGKQGFRPMKSPVSCTRKKFFGKKFQPMRAATKGYTVTELDMCCLTRLTHFQNKTLNNIYGEKRTLVHLPKENLYQFIPHGICAGQKAKCTGSCVQRTQIHPLLVLSEKHGVVFEEFHIPSYCSCKNIC